MTTESDYERNVRLNLEAKDEAEGNIKGKLVPVDMQVLADHQIDCYFSEWLGENGLTAPELWHIEGFDGNLFEAAGESWDYCKPRMNYWMSGHNHKDMLFLRELSRAGFSIDVSPMGVCFKITGLEEGYCWPWEAE